MSGRHPAADDLSVDDEQPRRHGWRHLLHDHWLIGIAVLAATVVRVLTMLAYPPAFWFPDSLPYVQAAAQLTPYSMRPIGYSFLLLALAPGHSIQLVIAVQHLMGVIVGVQTYALLRRHRMPSWASTLAAIPALFSVYAIQVEHFVLSDALFTLLVTSAMCLVLWRPRPRLWVCFVTGLLLAWATVDRSQGMLLILPFLFYLAIGRLGMSRFLLSAATMSVAFLVPILAYCAWFDATYGTFEFTTSNGAFLYSRVAVFVDCSRVKPPTNERWLCVSTPVSKRPPESWYVWATQSPLNHGPGWAFGTNVNHLATNFSERAITAQPLSYLRVVWDSTIETFVPLRDTNKSYQYYVFPKAAPEQLRPLAAHNGEDPAYGYAYNGGVNPSTRVVQPYARWMQAYERNVAMPGPLLGVIVFVGLLGGVLAWRRCGPTVAAWTTGAILIVTPAATADYDVRYVVAAIPAFCIAAALGVREVDYRVRFRNRDR